ncbi:MAG: alpha/beta hydrolase fold domain-containing protein [Acetobacteraceae bacterium]|nr:alpha/beta hydrolase fold domain-containing protein [Acetobacteraceae bacterium]
MRVDPLRLAVVGDSVGGNMAAVTLMAKQRHGSKIAHQVLFYPVTDTDFETPSYTEFADGPWLTKRAMQWFWNAYLPDPASRKQPTATPLNASLAFVIEMRSVGCVRAHQDRIPEIGCGSVLSANFDRGSCDKHAQGSGLLQKKEIR